MITLTEDAKTLSEKLAYAILGSYARGVAEGETDLTDISPVDLGRDLCTLDRSSGEGFNLLGKINISGFESAPKRLGYLKNLASYAEEKIMDYATVVEYIPNISPEAKKAELHKIASDTAKSVVYMAYQEGLVDDELKADLRTLLKNGKEEFEKRMQEATASAPAPVESVDAPETAEANEQNQEDGFDDMNYATADDDQAINDMDAGASDDLGFDTSFDDNSTDGFDNAASNMDKISGGDTGTEDNGGFGVIGGDDSKAKDTKDSEEDEEGKGEEFIIPFNDFQAMAEHMEFFKDDTDKIIEYINRQATCVEDMKFMYKGNLVSFCESTMNELINKYLDFENTIVNTVAKSEGASVIGSAEYTLKSRALMQRYALILVTREKLKI